MANNKRKRPNKISNQNTNTSPEQEGSSRKRVPRDRKADKRNNKRMKKDRKKAAKKEKRANWSIGKKIRRFLLKLFMTILFLAALIIGAVSVLSYFDVISIPLLSDFDQNSFLEFVNERNITVEEKDIIMTSENEGTATIVVTLPDYESLFENALTSEDPDNYLLKSLFFRDFETQKFELSANVIVESGEKVIQSDEVVHQLLEKRLIDAINALTEVK